MFPLLPALILLLMHGPSAVDRAQQPGGLPDAIRALHQRIQDGHRQASRQLIRDLEQNLVLASMLSTGSDSELGKAFAELLQLVEVGATPPDLELPKFHPATPRQVFQEPTLRDSATFPRSARTRDGPSAS